MRLLPFFATALVVAASVNAAAQIDARLIRYHDVSATQIVFTYANDLWLVPAITCLRIGSLSTRVVSGLRPSGGGEFMPG